MTSVAKSSLETRPSSFAGPHDGPASGWQDANFKGSLAHSVALVAEQPTTSWKGLERTAI
jgi:hypothetical protein